MLANNRRLRRALLVTMGLWPIVPALAAKPAPVLVEVWKDPSCGCCKDWIVHMRDAGFAVKVNEVGNEAARKRLGIPPRLGSCHTATVASYAIEGHVPARDIQRLLREKPQAIGLAAPGMPVGAPGMDGAAYGGRRTPHDVLLVLKSGDTRVYASYRS